MKNEFLKNKYAITAWFYDLLDYPWEKQYKKWRPILLSELEGNILEAGSGTGRNFSYYSKKAKVTAVELSPAMIKRSMHRKIKAIAKINVKQADATQMSMIDSNQYDWIISTFMCCVMPDELQPEAINEFSRVLKPGGRFKLLEMVYSENPQLRKRQERFSPWVEKVYGARFDRNTLKYIKLNKALMITQTSFLKDDTYLLIEGYKI
jgi:ubiquinone/menaquinone biosynthesis C-methylase UbiE